jgi:hypothetical protein
MIALGNQRWKKALFTRCLAAGCLNKLSDFVRCLVQFCERDQLLAL